MLLSVSNIGWKENQDSTVYAMMQTLGFSGLEIAPTRIFPQNPYDNLSSANEWAKKIEATYGFTITSMQSIWYGKQEKLFGSQKERSALLDYTKKAIDFAHSIGCKNLVFGCPKNRSKPEFSDEEIAISFFKSIGDYAVEKNTVIGIEANPPIYNTNYINDTQAALDLINRVNSRGFKLNLDVGAMIHNDESVDVLRGAVDMINHVHISQPGLVPIEKQELHGELAQLLRTEGYSRFISIEMAAQENITALETAMTYVSKLFR